MTREELERIEARVQIVRDGNEWVHDIEGTARSLATEDVPALATALREAWAEIDRLRSLIRGEP